jgi:hypothetical protein
MATVVIQDLEVSVALGRETTRSIKINEDVSADVAAIAIVDLLIKVSSSRNVAYALRLIVASPPIVPTLLLIENSVGPEAVVVLIAPSTSTFMIALPPMFPVAL